MEFSEKKFQASIRPGEFSGWFSGVVPLFFEHQGTYTYAIKVKNRFYGIMYPLMQKTLDSESQLWYNTQQLMAL